MGSILRGRGPPLWKRPRHCHAAGKRIDLRPAYPSVTPPGGGFQQAVDKVGSEEQGPDTLQSRVLFTSRRGTCMNSRLATRGLFPRRRLSTQAARGFLLSNRFIEAKDLFRQ